MPANDFTRTTPFLAFGGKIDPIKEIRNAGILTNGNVWWVANPDDAQHRVRTDTIGRGVMSFDIQTAVDRTLADNNDYVLVIPADDNAAWSFGTALDLDKDRLHLIAVGHSRAKFGYSAQILGSTGTVPDSEVVSVTGDAVELAGFHLKGTQGTHDGGTMTNAVLYVNADDFWGHNLFVEMNEDGWSETPILNFGGTKHGALFEDCDFSVRGTGNEEESATGFIDLQDGGKHYRFKNCTVDGACGSTAAIIVASGTGNKEWTEFINCNFMNRDISIVVASAFTGSTTADSPVFLMNCTATGVADMGTDPTVYVSPASSGTMAAAFNPGLGVGTALAEAV